MISLNNVSIVIPFYMDSDDRMENLYITLNYLLYNIDAEFILPVQCNCESDFITINEYIKNNFPNNIKIIKLIQNTPCHKTRLTNMAVFKCTNDIIVLYDLDVLIDIIQLKKSIDYMKLNSIDFIFPYTNPAYDVPYKLKEYLIDYANINLDVLRNSIVPRYVTLSPDLNEPEIGYSPGWCVIFTKESYINSGGDNEDFIGACSEDSERIYRYVNLGFKCIRYAGDVFHLEHPRLQIENEHEHHLQNSYFYKVILKNMTTSELKNYAETKKRKILTQYKAESNI